MSVKVIDTDPGVLQKTSEAALHAAEQSWAHLNAELVFETNGEVDSVMATLVDNEPYSFISGGSEGQVVTVGEYFKPGVAITRDAVFKHYSWVHGTYVIEAFDPLVEIRGDWYTYFESITTLGVKATGDTIKMVNMVLLACGTGRGITGEISWTVDPNARDAAAAAGISLEQQRWRRVENHNRYLRAYKDGDVDAILDVLGDEPQSIIRDYVDNTGALINLDGAEAHRNFYTALFDRYELLTTDILHRLSQDSYLFAETRITARQKQGVEDGSIVSFNTAEWFAQGEEGTLVRMGHGTDPV